MEASPSTEKIRQILEGLGIGFEIREFPEGTRTSRDAALAIGCDIAQIAKSIAFSAGKSPVLVVASGSNRIDTEKLGQHLGEKVFMMSPNQVREVTGFAIGGVPPVGHRTAMDVIIDRDLMQHDVIWAAAGTPRSVFSLSPAELAKITSGEVMDIRE